MTNRPHVTLDYAIACTVLAFGLIGCDVEARPAFAVRDSAHVTIVESAKPAWQGADGWTVAESPLLDLGGSDSLWFYRIGDTKMFSDGRIAVAEMSSQQIRVFDSGGGEIALLGGRGDGPGEFRYLGGLTFLGRDTLVAFDHGIKAVMYSPDLALTRTWRLPAASTELYIFDNELFVKLLSQDVGGSRPLGKVVREPGALLRLTGVGLGGDTIAILPGDEEVFFAIDGGLVSTAPFFGRQEHVAVGMAGLSVGDAVELGYRVIARNGLVTRIVRVTDYDLGLAAAEIRRERAARRSPNPTLQRVVVDALPLAERRPAYDRLRVDQVGHLWARGYLGMGGRDDPPRWEVFDTLGRWLGSVTTPAGLDVHQIGEQFILGVSQQQDGSETVQVWELMR